MGLDLTFKQVCELIKKDGKQEPKLIGAVDNLLGLALVCSPAVLGPTAVALLPTIAAKNEIVKLGKGIFEKLSKKKDSEYVARQERMQMAYGLVVFTAFFEALDSMMPDRLREKIGLLESEKAFIAKEAVVKSTQSQKHLPGDCDCGDAPLATVQFAFPHPTESLAKQAKRHDALWKQMALGFSEFIQKLAVWEQADEKEQALMSTWTQKLAEEAAKNFEAQYFDLSRRFADFAVWANLQEHKKTKELISDLSEYAKIHATLAEANEKAIDIGFSKLHSAVRDIPETLKVSQSTELVESLTKHYQARISDPIIEDKEDPQEGKPRLSFPRISDAFIPQAFRVLRQSGKGQRLEDEETWKDLDRRNDLGAFLLSYLTSPYSTETPLLILGHPGSGKSLLTTVLSSQLMSKHFTAIRVPLREVNAEAGIVSQIEDAIRRITNISVDSWAKLSSAFKNNPPLVILDGYDELLQASGKVFAGYLKDVQDFQRNETEQGRPVRVIVTSRVTLIDKATVPPGSTIVRLLEFDEKQRERWMLVWNKANSNYFREAKIEEFALPEEGESGAEKVLALAEQPLLLLMLALYDSQDNQLRKSKGLDRTRLYDSLLRRFVTRERGKEKGFDDTRQSEKKKALDTEMQRLGVAALGMYNRRKVHILAPELNDDLKFFNLERKMIVASGRALSEADLLLGSFFFVHKSKAQQGAGAADTHEETSAFEFLHNTFGEFLTADFILRRAVAQVETLRAYQTNEALREAMEKMLNSADGLSRDWLASLVYTPLFTRPVVLEMMREWIVHILKERNLSMEGFLEGLETIVLNQIKRLLNKREMPSIICTETAQEGYRALFGDHPLLGHVAIYSVNLILLRVIVSGQSFIFEESRIDTHEDGARPWDRLAHIWRSWFSMTNLNGVTAVMQADRKDSQISVRAKTKFQVAESQNRLETCLSVAISLGDNISSGLTGLLLFEPSSENLLTIDNIAERLSSEKIEAGFQVAMKRLFQAEKGLNADRFESFVHLALSTLEMALSYEKRRELEHIVMSLRRGLIRMASDNILHLRIRRTRDEAGILHRMIDPALAANITIRNPQAGLLMCQIAEEISEGEWNYDFIHAFFESVFRRYPEREIFERYDITLVLTQIARQLSRGDSGKHYEGKKSYHPALFDRVLDPQNLLDLCKSRPDVALAWIQLVRDLSGSRFFERHGDEFLMRAGDGTYLSALLERNPEAAIGLLQLASESGGERFKKRFRKFVHPDFFERALHSHNLLELAEHNPEIAFTWVRLVRELNSKHFDGKFFPPKLFERIFRLTSLLKLVGRNPEIAFVWIQIAQELSADFFTERRVRELFEQMFDSSTLYHFLRHKPAAFGVALRLARIADSKQICDVIAECLVSSMREFGKEQSVIETLPIGVLQDVKWLAKYSKKDELQSALSDLR